MGWFDEQIRQRREADNEAFADSFREIAGAVTGNRMTDSEDSRKVTTDAIDEILHFYHAKPKELPDSMTDLNEVLEYLMRPYGIMRRTVRLEPGWYKDAAGAMLAHRKDDGSAVALIPCGLTSYRFFDRKTGKYVTLNKKTESMLAPMAIAFYKPFPLRKMTVGDLCRYIVGQITPSGIVMIVLATLVVTLVGMLTPKLNALLFSDALDSGSTLALTAIGVFMLCAALSMLIFSTVKDLVVQRFNTKMSLSVRAASIMRVLSLPADFFKKYNAGELSSRIGYINSLANQLTNMVFATGMTSLFSLLYITQIFAYAPSLVVPALAIVLLTVVLSVVTTLLQMRVTRRQMQLAASESGMSFALISGIQKIRLSGAEKRAFARWGRLYAQQAELTYNPPLFLKVSGVFSMAISLIGTLVIYLQAVRNNVSIPEYYAFNAAYGMVSGAFLSLAGIAGTIANIKPTLEMARPILETAPEIDEDKTVVTRLSGGVELNNVTFRYREDMPAVLDDLSLKIRPGQYVAIVGKTGCGKSTLMRILLGFETPQKGAVYYDGRDIKSLDPKSLRRHIGAVMQDGKLFTGDIFSNIVISAPWLTLKDAWEAAETAGIADDIRSMPMGMNTLISEGSGGVSGGQRQRLMIARAIAPKPRILMFDEATSALDNITQKQVSDALDRMKCTRIVIAHRLSTIRQCDRIIVLDGGKITEDGTYEELIARNGHFAELVARQRLDHGETTKEA